MEKENSFFLHHKRQISSFVSPIKLIIHFSSNLNYYLQLIIPSFFFQIKKKLHKTDLIAPKDRTKTFIALDERLCLNQTKLYFDVAQLAPFFENVIVFGLVNVLIHNFDYLEIQEKQVKERKLDNHASVLVTVHVIGIGSCPRSF